MDVDELKSRMEALDALHELESRLKKVREENERLKAGMREIYEVWAGSEGPTKEYTWGLINEMRDIAGGFLK